MEYLCAMCKVRHVYGKGVDRSKPAVKYMNPVDKLTSTVSWPTVWSKYCYFCDKKNDGLIKLQGQDTSQVEKEETFQSKLK